MSPILNAETLRKFKEFEEQKFVRDGDVIAFDRWQVRHAVIAEFNGVGSCKPHTSSLVDMDAITVDDAGSLVIIRDKLRVSGDSTTCVIRGDTEEQRKRTIGILHELTNRQIVTE